MILVTVAFVEARETGQRSLAGLSGTSLSSQSVNIKPDLSKFCKNWGEKGHSSAHRKVLCKAYKAVCKKCKGKGHFTA